MLLVFSSAWAEVDFTDDEKAWLESHPVLRIGFNRNWAPIGFLDENGDFQGVSSDYTQLLGSLLGVKFEFVKDLPSQQAMALFKRGGLDLFTSLRPTPEREATFDFSDVYTSFPVAIFAGPEAAYIGSIEQLQGSKVAVVEGYSVQAFMTDDHPNVELVATKNITEALEKLSRGEVDAYVGNLLATNYYIGQLDYSHIKAVGYTDYRYEQRMAVRKDWPILVSIINKALATISEAEQTSIHARWAGVRHEQGIDYVLLGKVASISLIIILLFLYWSQRLAHLNKQLERAREQERLTLLHAQRVQGELESVNKVDKLQSMFIASMSHELRTPLNSIIGFSGLLLQGVLGDLNEQQKDSLARIHRSGNHLLDLITDVIDISKIEAGRIEVFTELFSLEELVAEAIEDVRLQAGKKGLALEVQADDWPSMNTDRKRVLQCLLNYLSNAVKFTEEGKIILSVTVKGDKVDISVSDTGIGIAGDEMPRLFEAFEHLESHLRVKAGGSGLGLYLTKKVVEDLLEGTLSIESQLDKGSTFGFTIPMTLRD